MNPEEAVVDPREIDRVLSELAGMVGRWSLFRKFLTESLSVVIISRFEFFLRQFILSLG